MSKKNHYPWSISMLHWLLALLVIANFVLGWMLDDAENLMAAHKSIGTLILLLMLIRVANKARLRHRLPASVNPAGSVQYMIEKLVHGLLYLCLFAVPLLGWLKTNAAGHELNIFDMFSLPTLVSKSHNLSMLFGEMHETLATLFAILIALHVAAALWHHFSRLDGGLVRILPLRNFKR
ncbi:cytochrome b [Chromobacterium sphagni]|uniref:Cytochrome B n=1 Tax=Chromobacterium sphagni TaxID=1903179 RepID=A0ABX3CAL7_9NEIS|nr:cytochrome b [Chromobacterium sphagni]OHX19184.1 cytochrome B [Chromobacterium sphagni]